MPGISTFSKEHLAESWANSCREHRQHMEWLERRITLAKDALLFHDNQSVETKQVTLLLIETLDQVKEWRDA